MSVKMVNDEQFKPVKLRIEIIAEIDRIKQHNPFLRTRPDVIKYILHRYVEDQNNNGGNGGDQKQYYTASELTKTTCPKGKDMDEEPTPMVRKDGTPSPNSTVNKQDGEKKQWE